MPFTSQQPSSWMGMPPSGSPDLYAALTDMQQSRFRSILMKTFAWMGLGLLLSALAAYGAVYTAIGRSIFFRVPFFIFVIVELGLVIAVNVSLYKVKPALARVLFILYSLINGLTMSVILLAYEVVSVAFAFFAAALVFGVMALWGYYTKRNLSVLGTIGRMLLIGALIVSALNLLLARIFPAYETVDYIMNYVILAVFVGLTAADMQRIRMMAFEQVTRGDGPYVNPGFQPEDQQVRSVSTLAQFDGAMLRRDETLALGAALTLYLNFINLFLRILRIFGRSRN